MHQAERSPEHSRRPKGSRRKLVRSALLLAIATTLSACATGGPLDSLDPRGPIAEDIDWLFKLTLYIAIAIFVLVQGAILVAAVLYRDRPGRKEPKQTHGNAKLEVVWTVIPVLILAAIAVPTVQRVFKYTDCSADALNVELIGHQWWFEYRYDDFDIDTANVLAIPTNTEVCLRMTSEDVLHNYWIPKLNGKRYLVPGQETILQLIADEPGEYWGHCGEFCGLSHALMRARVMAYEPADFEAWVAEQQAPPVEPGSGSLEAAGLEIFLANQCAACHNIDEVNPLDAGIGPDLTHFASRNTFAGAILELDEPGALESWLANPPAIKPGSFMPNLNLSQDEIDALSAYLRSLE